MACADASAVALNEMSDERRCASLERAECSSCHMENERMLVLHCCEIAWHGQEARQRQDQRMCELNERADRTRFISRQLIGWARRRPVGVSRNLFGGRFFPGQMSANGRHVRPDGHGHTP